jgi:hypothetical protein
MANPDINPEAEPRTGPSALDGLLTVLATTGMMALAAKGLHVSIRSLPKGRIEAAKATIARGALGALEAVVKHPMFKSVSSAFLNKPIGNQSPHSALKHLFGMIDRSQMGLMQDLSMVVNAANPGADLLQSISTQVLTKYDREIPALSVGRFRRMTFEDVQSIARGAPWQDTFENTFGLGSQKNNWIAKQLGLGSKQLNQLRLDPWLFYDPAKKEIANLRSLNVVGRAFDALERVEFLGIPLFRMRGDTSADKMGSALFGRRMNAAGAETTNPVLKMLSKGAMDKGEVAVVGGKAWSRASQDDAFTLMKGVPDLGLTSDPRRGMVAFTALANSSKMVDETLYGKTGAPKGDWQRFSRWLGIDFGPRSPYSVGGAGTLLDDIGRKPGSGMLGRLKSLFQPIDHTGFIGGMQDGPGRTPNIGARTPFLDFDGKANGYMFLKRTGAEGAADYANQLATRPYYLFNKLGVNIRPGANALTSMAKVAGLAMGAYMGYEGVKYADWATGGIASGLLRNVAGYGTYARQRAYEATGIRGGVEGADKEFPGLLTSPLAKFLMVGGAAIGGSLLGAKFGAPNMVEKALRLAAKRTNREGVQAGIRRSAIDFLAPMLTKFGATGSTAKTTGHAAKAVGGSLLGLVAGSGLTLGATYGDIKEKSESVRERMRGERKVPYHASAGWIFGRDPYSGGRIRYNRESRLHSFGTDYDAIAVYGSEGNKWKYGSWLPTLQNLGGARRLVNPYYAEDRNYNTRPYPVTSGLFGDVPVFGPILQSTIGSVLKPTRVRGSGSAIMGAGGGENSLGAMNQISHNQAMAALQGSYAGGHGFVSGSPQQFGKMGMGGGFGPAGTQSPNDVALGLTYQLRSFEEYIGLRGFQSQFIRQALFGSAYPTASGPVLAGSGAMTSASRAYYDAEPGGLFGMSELLRRFMIRPLKQPTVNEIPNTLPNWLPGSLSMFEKDRNYFTDFSRGDPYTALPQGNARLPGPGYESLHPLHGGTVYDILDSFLILADVAPFTQAYRVMKAEVERKISKGQIESKWIRRYEIAIEQAENRAEFRTFHSRKYNLQAMMTVDQVLSANAFTVKERPGEVIQLAGATVSKADRIKVLAQLQHGGLSAEQAGEKFLAMQSELKNLLMEKRGQSIQLSITGSRRGSVVAELPEYSQAAEELGIADESNLREQGPLGKAYTASGKMLGVGGAAAGFALGLLSGGAKGIGVAEGGSTVARILAAAGGAVIGGVLGGWAQNKFTGDFSAVEHYQRFNKYGTSYADWNAPVTSFLRTWMHQGASTVADYTPGFRKEQYSVEQYFDNLKYMKYNALEAKANDVGDQVLSQQFNRMKSATMAALPYDTLSASTPGLMEAIPANERQYFAQFAAEADPAEQKRILANVPSYMRAVYLSIWRNEGGKQFADPELLQNYGQTVAPLVNSSVDERVQDYFETNEAPSGDWAGWHPAANLQDVKYKAVQMRGGQPHDYGMYSNQGARIDAFQPWIGDAAEELNNSIGAFKMSDDVNLLRKFARGVGSMTDFNMAPGTKMGRNKVTLVQDNRQSYADYYARMARGNIGIW